MNNPLGLRILTHTVAGVMTISVVACTKPADAIDAPAASITIGTTVDDSVITTRVKSALLDNIDIKSFDIKVETRKGEVMLSGFVDNQTQVDHAIKITSGIEGVKGVDNKLSLKDGVASLGNKIDDGVITTKIKSALLSDANIKSADIMVTTRKGEVQLSGFVNNQAQMDRAIQVSQGIEGVTKVGNDMSIKK
jgi:hyperosmotically inducible protein